MEHLNRINVYSPYVDMFGTKPLYLFRWEIILNGIFLTRNNCT
jgi:hypothetical protein